MEGIVGKSEITYDFVENFDSINIEITHHFISPIEKFKINIGKSQFEKIKNQILCISKIDNELHSNVPHQLFDSDYTLTSGWKRIFLRPKNQDTCKFYHEIPQYDTLQTLLTK